MLKLFEYNWRIREAWFDWCREVPHEELTIDRVGGVGSILYTLFHIVEVEYSWLRVIRCGEDIVVKYADHQSLDQIQALSNRFHQEIKQGLHSLTNRDLDNEVSVSWDNSVQTVDDILHHMVAHEIHHSGQLSIWSRELGRQPVVARFLD
ncbi:DinB family protein [Geomicrobium sediminis]|uniref:Damage-inducible protein DinB n=1 Tax=Geomicrobium sediminis TaxID=1347788 RepID=A0ABS2PA74_9BACL|nr:DinB family protein [Geomicrobium sediminis]MBM7632304.1 putative damage-inducible protein DinB [Geomicrobium sediminis]